MARRPRLRLLVTAGPTREYLDPVRYISNDSSGRMGFAIARAAVRRGWHVTLVHGPVSLQPPPGVRAIPVLSAADMLAACRNLWPRHDVLVMAAAVADYTPVRPARRKHRKSPRDLVLRLTPTSDILKALSASRRADQVVVGFALEDRTPRARALAKLKDKALDAIVLNRPAAIGAAHSTLDAFVPGEGWQTWAAAAKTRHGARLVRLLERLFRKGDRSLFGQRPRRR